MPGLSHLTPHEMPHSARPAQDCFSDSGNRMDILGKVKRLVSPCSESLALPQPPGLFCMLDGTSLPRPFLNVYGPRVYGMF